MFFCQLIRYFVVIPNAVKPEIFDFIVLRASTTEGRDPRSIQHRNAPGEFLTGAGEYFLTPWESLQNYLYDGNLQIDNNLIENIKEFYEV
jgi:hypothetical protein